MAQYCSDSESDSFDELDGEDCSTIDYGVHSLVSFGPPSVYGGGEEEDFYELVEGADDYYKVKYKCYISESSG